MEVRKQDWKDLEKLVSNNMISNVLGSRSNLEAAALSCKVFGGQHLTCREPGGSSFRLITADHNPTFHPQGVEQAISLLGFCVKAPSADWLLVFVFFFFF